ncbi:MAG: Transcriptional regulator MraZ [Synergistaceae bacterium]
MHSDIIGFNVGQSGTKWSKVGDLSMLVGSYNHKLDGKGRTVLPARFRGELGSSIVATIGIDRCIALYPVSRWEELILKLKDLSSFKKKTRDFRRVLLSMATELEIDGSGRVLIPSGLREYAGVDQEVTLIGLEDHLEVWDSIRWEEQRSGVLMDFSDLAEDLEGI